MANKKFSVLKNLGPTNDNLKGMAKFFDFQWYLETYPEVQELIDQGAYRSAFYHYIHIGGQKGYSPSPDFDEEFYVQANPDVNKALEKGEIRCGYHHYLAYGEREGRDPKPIPLEESDARQALISIFNETNNNLRPL